MALQVKEMQIIIKADYSVSPTTYKTSIVQYQIYDPSNPDLVKDGVLEDMNVDISSGTLADTLLNYIDSQVVNVETQEGL